MIYRFINFLRLVDEPDYEYYDDDYNNDYSDGYDILTNIYIILLSFLFSMFIGIILLKILL